MVFCLLILIFKKHINLIKTSNLVNKFLQIAKRYIFAYGYNSSLKSALTTLKPKYACYIYINWGI